MLECKTEIKAFWKWPRFIQMKIKLDKKDTVTLNGFLIGKYGIIAWRAPWRKWTK